MKKYLSILCKWDGESDEKYLNEPFSINGRTYSMNNFCLIRVDGTYGFGPEEGKIPPVSDFDFASIESAKESVSVPRREIFDNYEFCGLCKGSGQVFYKRKPCKVCGESGYVECECCGNEKMCSVCEGDGWTAYYVETAQPCEHCHATGLDYQWKSIDIKGFKLDPMLLIKLDNELPNFKIMIDSRPCKNAVGFKFDHGYGIIMTMLK